MDECEESVKQKWPERLVLVRHGESQRNVDKALAKLSHTHGSFGSGLRDVDTPLTVVGCEQARKTGEYLSGRYSFDVALSSPYKRTRQTTEHILSAFETKPPLVIEERVREIEFGVLDGLTAGSIEGNHPEEFRRREKEGKYWYRPAGGESRPDVALRVHSCLGTLIRDYSKKSVLVVCHSVVVLIFRRLLERWDEEQYMKVDKENDVLNCSITIYEFDGKKGKLALKHYNQDDHLRSA